MFYNPVYTVTLMMNTPAKEPMINLISTHIAPELAYLHSNILRNTRTLLFYFLLCDITFFHVSSYFSYDCHSFTFLTLKICTITIKHTKINYSKSMLYSITKYLHISTDVLLYLNLTIHRESQQQEWE